MREAIAMSGIQLALFQDRVTWPHSWRSGHSIHTSTREGRLVGKQGEEIAVVHYRGKDYRVFLGNVRQKGEITAQTEAVLRRGMIDMPGTADPDPNYRRIQQPGAAHPASHASLI